MEKNIFSMNCIMNKNLKHIIMATEYVEMKKKGLEYIRGISSTAEQISEIDVELTAMKAIQNSKAKITNTSNLESILKNHNDIILNAIEEFVQNCGVIINCIPGRRRKQRNKRLG